MRKVSRQNPMIARGGWRLLAAASLAASLSLFGCTSDRIPGSGAPDRNGPGLGQAPSATPGSESNNPIPVHMSMASSMSFEAATAQVLRRVNVDALATAAANAGFRGRVLGIADPATGSSTTGIAGIDNPTGQFINPAVISNPQYTVNSSINSVGVVPAIGADFGGTGAAGVVGAVSVGAVSNSNAAISNLTAIPNQTTAVSPVTTLPTVTTTPGALLTPTTAAIQTTVGQFAAGPGVQTAVVPSTLQPGAVTITNVPTGSLTPTVSSGAMISPVVAANSTIATVGTTTATTSAVRASNVTSPATIASTSHRLVISQGSTGITISNVGNATSAVSSTKGTTSGNPIILNVKP